MKVVTENQLPKPSLVKVQANVPVNDCLTKPLTVDNQLISKAFWFLKRSKNEQYQSGLKNVPFRSCLLLNKAAVSNQENQWRIKTEPKWFTDLLESRLDLETGEILSQSVYRTDDLTSGNNRKIKALNRFCDRFQPMYSRHQVSVFFYTFTVANQAKRTIKETFSIFKKRLKRNGLSLKGYIWVLEISKDLHVHYHALVATERIFCTGKKLPEYLKLNNVWGARTQVRFAEAHIRNYLSKYFSKNKYRIESDETGKRKRQYGISMPNFK